MRYQLDYRDYEDKVFAAWLGKSIGGTVGAYVENHKERKQLTAAQLWPPAIPPNDDLDIQLVWLEAMQARGCWLTGDDLAAWWQDRCWYNFCEYGFFLNNLQRGIMPPWSGYWNNDYFRESEGCPIRSDIWGLVAPGNPALAAELARYDGELDHAGFSVQAEQFYAAMTAQALVAATREEIVAAGLSVLPCDAKIREVVANVAAIARDYPDFAAAWQVTMRCYGDRDASKAITNLAIVMLAWELAGDGDFQQAMVNCVNSGWDCDCTAATLGGILGAWKGTAFIPEDWRTRLGPNLVCGIEVEHKNAPLIDIGRETALVGAEMALARNGRITLLHAPEVRVRPQPAPRLNLSVDYPDGPVLWAAAATATAVLLDNPTAEAFSGELAIHAAPGALVSPERLKLRLAPGENRRIDLRIWRETPTDPLPDKNLFRAELISGGRTVAERVFGLGGARQWLAYGPYWDMYDREKYGDDCPYAGSKGNLNPGSVGCLNDSYQIYQYLDREYLDEAALLQRDLAELAPRYFESGIDLLTEKDFGGWHGPAVWYLVRTIVVPAGRKLIINAGRSGMLKVWIDGRECLNSPRQQSWAVGDWIINLEGTGRPQRLVAKLQAPGDQAALSLNFIRDEPLHLPPIRSYLTDEIVDVVPPVGYRL